MLIDITQELLSCRVYPGDPAPERTWLKRVGEGDPCNLSALSLCSHNGTHVDAPRHFLEEGRSLDQMGLEPFVGPCWVARCHGEIGAEDAAEILEKARAADAAERILAAGPCTLTEAGARVFAGAGLLLYGNESQTVGPEDAPMAVHLILLGADTALLEGVVLSGVEEGRYFLNAAPLKAAEGDGAPCRAWLMR